MKNIQKEAQKLTTSLKEVFKENLNFVALTNAQTFGDDFGAQVNIVLNILGDGDIYKLKTIMQSFANELEIGLFTDVVELDLLSRQLLVPLFTDCTILYGKIDESFKVSLTDVRNLAINTVGAILQELRAQVLYSDAQEVAANTYYMLKDCVLCVQYLYYLKNKKYITNLNALRENASDIEYALIDIYQNFSKLKNDRQNNPQESINFLTNFCRYLLKELNTK